MIKKNRPIPQVAGGDNPTALASKIQEELSRVIQRIQELSLRDLLEKLDRISTILQ